MINFNRRFADALRAVLTGSGFTTSQINQTIQGELKESQIASEYAQILTGIGDGLALKVLLVNQVMLIGGVYNVDTKMWNLAPTQIAFGIRVSATEDLSAICRFGGTPQFDAAKGVTNILRFIKVAERL